MMATARHSGCSSSRSYAGETRGCPRRKGRGMLRDLIHSVQLSYATVLALLQPNVPFCGSIVWLSLTDWLD